jgi:hypothetical protein
MTIHHIMCPPTRAATRREFLSHAAGVAAGGGALALAAIPAIAGDALSTDASLVELGRQLYLAIQRVQALGRLADELREPIDDAVEARATWPDLQRDWSHADARAYTRALNDVIAEIGSAWSATCAQHEAALDITEPLVRAIWAAPASTIAGFGVKVAAAMFGQTQLWDKPFADLDWDEKGNRCLIESLFAAAGLPSVKQYLGLQAAVRS